MSFSDADEEKLIDIVARYSVIYDAGHADYRNVLAKDNIWKTIGKELNKNSEDCKKKWKFIRDGYNRFKKKNKLGTGSGAPKNSKNKRHQQLLFLEGVSQHRSGGSNIPASPQGTIDNADEENDKEQVLASERSELQGNLENTEMQNRDEEMTEVLLDQENIPEVRRTSKSKEKRQRRGNNDDKLLKFWKDRDDKRQTLLKTIFQRKDDDVELFCRHIAEVLRNLPPVCKAKAKKHLSNVLSYYEIMAATQSSNTDPTYDESSHMNIFSSSPSSSSSPYDFSEPHLSPSSESADGSPGRS